MVRCGRHIWVVPFPADLPDERLTAGGGERLILGAPDDGHLALVLGPANLFCDMGQGWYLQSEHIS